MSRFLQLHLLTSYPPANLNRDDLGRPKTAVMGGKNRLRISSQSLKRHWRISDLFKESLGEHVGTRTKRLGPDIYDRLVEGGRTEKQAEKSTKAIAEKFGTVEGKGKKFLHKQVVHYSPAELRAVDQLADTLIEEGREPEKEDLDLLRKDHSTVDIAMFGRMLASDPGYNMEAAVQVAHALSVHEAAVEDDFFTAVDDLNRGETDSGSAHMGVTEFGTGLFYLYVCIDREQLLRNLQGNQELAERAVQALVEAAAKVAPSGKQNSFASRARANYILAEAGDEQPRSLSVAFLKPVEARESDEGMLVAAVNRIEKERAKMDRAYGPCAEKTYVMNIPAEEGNFHELLSFLGQNNA